MSMRGAWQCSGLVAAHFDCGSSLVGGMRPQLPMMRHPFDRAQCCSVVGRQPPNPRISKYEHSPMLEHTNDAAQSASLDGWQSVERHSSLSPIGRYAHPPCSLHVSDARHAAWYCANRSGAIGGAIGAGALGCWQATNNSTGKSKRRMRTSWVRPASSHTRARRSSWGGMTRASLSARERALVEAIRDEVRDLLVGLAAAQSMELEERLAALERLVRERRTVIVRRPRAPRKEG